MEHYRLGAKAVNYCTMRLTLIPAGYGLPSKDLWRYLLPFLRLNDQSLKCAHIDLQKWRDKESSSVPASDPQHEIVPFKDP